MKSTILFLIFILYATTIFFIDNYFILAILGLCHILVMFIFKVNKKQAIENIFKLLPFILLTMIINWLLSNYQYAFLVGVKLLLVCNVTYIYAKLTTVRSNSQNNKKSLYTTKII